MIAKVSMKFDINHAANFACTFHQKGVYYVYVALIAINWT